MDFLLPAGISFYTFQGLSYLIDVDGGAQEPVRKLSDFAIFHAYFPQLVAGPIERARNLLPACKNLGVTHITNGCYRLHPVEWNIGEAAGQLAAFCARTGAPPRAVRGDPARLAAFQAELVGAGVELRWPEEVRAY